MVNGYFSKNEAQKLLKSKVNLDLHLTIFPITSKQLLSTGVLYRSLRFIFLLLTGKIASKRVAQSWNKQIEKFKKIFGRHPDGLNSHEHTHFFPPYFKIALKLCGKYKIPHIRFGNKVTLPSRNKISIILNILNKINRGYFLSYPLRVTSYEYLVSLDWINDFKSFLKNPPSGTVEIVCHPEREEEYQKLLDNKG